MTLADQGQHILFLSRQVDARQGGVGRDLCQQMPGDHRAHRAAAVMQHADVPGDLCGQRLLEQIARGPRAHALQHQVGVVEQGGYHDGACRPAFAGGFDDRDAGTVRQAQVHQQDICGGTFQQGAGPCTAVSLGGQPDIIGGFDCPAHGQPEPCIVLHHGQTDHVWSPQWLLSVLP